MTSDKEISVKSRRVSDGLQFCKNASNPEEDGRGEIEKEIINIGIKNTYIFRPSLLIGKRSEYRFGEKIAQIIMPMVSFLFPDNYKPIESFNVAKSMIKESKKTINRTKFYHFTDIMNILND